MVLILAVLAIAGVSCSSIGYSSPSTEAADGPAPFFVEEASDELGDAISVEAEGDEVLALTIDALSGPCAEGQVGALAGLELVDTTDTTLTIAYPPQDEPISIYVGANTYDVIPAGTSQFVVELLSPGVDNFITAAIGGESAFDGSRTCGRTLPVAQTGPIGTLMPTGLALNPVSETSAMLSWVSPPSGDGYKLYRGTVEMGSNLPDVVADDALSFDNTSHVFENLTPGEKMVLGIRTTNGNNVSSLAWVQLTVPG